MMLKPDGSNIGGRPRNPLLESLHLPLHPLLCHQSSFTINIVMFFIPILLMTICYSMIVAKLYCSSSPGERLGGVTPQVLLYINSDQSLPLVKHELETILIDKKSLTPTYL